MLNIALITTDFPPLSTSAAVQLRDLALEFVALGHNPMVLVPTSGLDSPSMLDEVGGIKILRLSAPPIRPANLIRRAIAEVILPFAMMRNFSKSPFSTTRWDLIVWYSPPIFFGLLVWVLRRGQRCHAYLILRDIFPQWAVDLGILRKGPTYFFFKAVAAFQYAVADTIGVQTESNLKYLEGWAKPAGRRIEVLHNWLATSGDVGCSISVAETSLAGRKIFVYIGNMGVAQGMHILVELAYSLRRREDIGFLFVGRGSEFPRLVAECASRALANVLFFDEIDSSEIPGLLSQCHVGLVALHPDHKTHNIPGKFVSYTQYGLPVLARLNAGTDLAQLIETHHVGRVYVGDSVEGLKRLAEELADNDALRATMSRRGQALGRTMFSPETAARQILRSSDPHQ